MTKKTLLNKWHRSHGANMADFGGYEMPLWYSSAKNEHLAVLTHAGLFDTSHMASILVQGPDAFELLQLCFTNDMNACIGKSKKTIFPGRCVYGAFLNEKAHVIDDAIIFNIVAELYMVVVNAGMGQIVADHLKMNKSDRVVTITDLSDQLGKLDIQGPNAAKILKKNLADSENILENMPYFSFKGYFDTNSPLSDLVHLKDGTPILLSRTGYTGEFGFEIFVEQAHFLKVWDMFLKSGDEFGLTVCGLAARDSLRAGAMLPLSHQDIGNWPFIHNPWPFALPWNETQDDFGKKFIGDKALLNIENPQYTYAFAGYDVRKVSLPAHVLNESGTKIGEVLTCATDMAIGRDQEKIYSIASPDKPQNLKIKGLCCGFVKVTQPLNFGQKIELKDSRRKISVQIEQNIRPHRTARQPMKKML